MASPMRISPELVEVAKKRAAVSKRSVPKQIEFWANLGKIVENIMDFSDLIAIDQGIKKIHIEPVEPAYVEPQAVFASLEKSRENGQLAQKVTSAAVYYEASRSRPGMIDRVNMATGERLTGKFRNGEFEAMQA